MDAAKNRLVTLGMLVAVLGLAGAAPAQTMTAGTEYRLKTTCGRASTWF